ncbi:MAG: hypothetical protein KAU94_00245 [Verrucomicrobia bacterium]|nr:hypothetical protein [Verrucomicrobiota bacterium]
MSAKRSTVKQTGSDNSHTEETGAPKCVGFHELTLWQVERYQQAVSENRWYMGQKYNRWIGWVEAEQDFFNHGYYGCAENWRHQYCGEICPFKNNCLLAIRLVKAAEPIPLPTAG